MESKPLGQGFSEAGLKSCENGSLERFRPALAPPPPPGWRQGADRAWTPPMACELMGVAQRMVGSRKPAIRFETAIDDHAAGQIFGHVAPSRGHAIELEAFGCDRMQPLRFARDPEAGSVERRTRAAATSAPTHAATGAKAFAFLAPVEAES